MWSKFKEWASNKIKQLDEWWSPPIKRFAKRNPRLWWALVAFLIAVPLGMTLLFALDFLIKILIFIGVMSSA